MDVVVEGLGKGGDSPLTYSLPDALRGQVGVGSLVLVPLRNSYAIGYVTNRHDGPVPFATKDVIAALEPDYRLPAPLMELAKWTADYYLCPLSAAVATLLPPAAKPRVNLAYQSAPTHPQALEGLPAQVYDHLLARRRPVSVSTLEKKFGKRDLHSAVGELKRLGMVAESVSFASRRRRETASPGELAHLAPRTSADAITLTAAQAEALRRIETALEEGTHRSFLLQGVTASGKTEIYLRAIARARRLGKEAIFLVPEISLTPQAIGQLRERFGESVALLHSRLSASERLEEWRRLAGGKAQIALGPRSALFAPLTNLGIIVVDEEHDESYKSQGTPPYDARLVAQKRARDAGAVLLFGSATPTLESYHLTTKGAFTYLELPSRVDGTPLPSVDVLDMRRESPQNKKLQLSKRLQEEVQETLARGEQVLLFLNRRGHSTFAMCDECGNVLRCPRCAVSLVLHRAALVLRCHHCGHKEKVPEVCPVCQGESLGFHGVGTEKVEENILAQFPQARVLRIDRDTTSRRGVLTATLRSFAAGEGDILVGTQMIGKGHDFGSLSLVGVISADTALSFPDFRAAERTFQMLTQVSGRAGRGGASGRVIVQSYNPTHYSIQAAQNHDFQAFCDFELRERRRLLFPPFVNLVRLVLTHSDQARVVRLAHSLASALKRELPVKGKAFELLGPAPAPLYKLKKRFRWHILIKTDDVLETTARLERAFEGDFAGDRRLIDVDVDPVSLM